MKSLIHTLVSIANKCDESSLYKEAEKLDSIITKLAQVPPGTPVGRPFKDQKGNMIRTYRTPTGEIIQVPVNQRPARPEVDAVEEDAVEEEEASFFEKYNPFSGLTEALNSNPDGAAKQQSKSELPHLKNR